MEGGVKRYMAANPLKLLNYKKMTQYMQYA